MKIILFKCMVFTCILISTNGFTCTQVKDPSRITVAGGSITEILYAIEAQEKIVAVDITSYYPIEASSHPSIGYVRTLSAEGILSLDPTLILGEDDMGPPSVINQIKRTGIDVSIVPEEHSVEGIINKINCIGNIIGMRVQTEAFISKEILPKIKELDHYSSMKNKKKKKVIFILGLQSGSPIVGGINTSADGFIKMIGGINPMSEFENWKPVNAESIISSAPDVILVTARGLKAFGDMETLINHPSLALTPAAKNNRIFSMDGMAMLGFSPRTIDSAINISKKLND